MAKPRRTTKQSKQTGGTFLGIVLGLIVGLAIAVVVALYITRAPTPFVAKVAPPAASDTSASEAQYDPNRPLQGKTPGQPVPQAAQPAPPNTAPGQTKARRSPGMLQEPEIVEVPPASSANANGVAVAPKPAQDNGAGRSGEEAAAGHQRADQHRGGARVECRQAGLGRSAFRRRREQRLLPAGWRLQDVGGRRAAACAPRLPGLRIEGHAARCRRCDVLSRAHRAVLEVRGHEFGPPASVRRRGRYRRDPLHQAVMFRHAPPLNLSVRRESQARQGLPPNAS